MEPIDPSVIEACRWPGTAQAGWSGWFSGGTGRLVRLASVAAGLLAAYALWRRRQRQRRRERRQRWDSAGRDVVVLHQFARAAISPNLSPFAVKVETFLRMAGFRYVVDSSKPLGPKGKCPWITVNGQDVTDSELIIEHLLTLRPDALPGRRALTAEQRAVGRAVQVALDEHLVVAMAAHRFVADRLRHLVPMMAARYRRRYGLLRPLAALLAAASFRRIGWIDCDPARLAEVMRRHLEALVALLGERPFLLGDEATEFDAAVFGQLTQLLTGCAPEVRRLARSYPSLVRYFERIREQYWPDWEQCMSP